MHSVLDIVKTALAEDIGPGDITTDNTVDPFAKGKGIIIAKEPLVLAGIDVAKLVFEQFESPVVFQSSFKDGNFINIGEVVLTIEAKLRTLLTGERTALNFLQHLSGIATLVRSYVNKTSQKSTRIVDTRKTTPGLRVLEKYAVRVGGAFNHRMGLYDGILIKDNHIAACGSISSAIKSIKSKISHLLKIEVEVSCLHQVKEALEAGADVIMLDNMDIEMIKKALQLINHKALVEVSGGVNINNIAEIADTGVDIISVGALTHSARSVDLSMRIEAVT